MISYQPNMKRNDQSAFLQKRELLKESIRKKTQNGNRINVIASPTSESEQRKRKLPYNDFGSFFGPSQPAIASRVLRASKTEKSSDKKKSSSPTNGLETKNPNEPVKSKAEKLKDARDYSFLFSDDAELPASLKPQPPSPNDPTPDSRPKTEIHHSRPATSGTKTSSKAIIQARTKEESVENSQPRKLISKNSQLTTQRLAPTRKPEPVDNRRNLGTSKQERVEQRKVSQEVVTRSQPLKQSTQQQQLVQKKKMKKKPARRSEEDELALRMVREMCKSDRYAGIDDADDSDMEANFEDILKEERRSERLGKKEDAEQLRLIEEENRRERMKKKQKLSH